MIENYNYIRTYIGKEKRIRHTRCYAIRHVSTLESMRDVFIYEYKQYVKEDEKSIFLETLSEYVSCESSLIYNNRVASFVKDIKKFVFSPPPLPSSVDLPLDELKKQTVKLEFCIMEKLEFQCIGYCLLDALLNLQSDFLHEVSIFFKNKGLENPLPGQALALADYTSFLKRIEHELRH